MADALQAVVREAGRLDSAVAAAVPQLSRSRAARLVRDGAVRVEGDVITKASHAVDAGCRLEVVLPPPEPAEAQPQDLPLSIVYEDEDLAVIDKAPGMVVHPGPGHPDGTLVNALLFHLDGLSGIGGVQRPGIVHRLDRGTSGLLVVAKHDASHQGLAEQFAAHTAGRRYLAVVYGAPEAQAGTITSTLARHPRDRVRWASTEGTRGKRAITHWAVQARAGTVSLVECRLETGRTHQVRVHLTEQGWPLVGDGLYRRRGTRLPSTLRGVVDDSGDRPLLHAWQLHLTHPRTGERLTLRASPPADFLAVLDALGLEEPEASLL